MTSREMLIHKELSKLIYYIPAHEVTHAANEIIKADDKEQAVLDMTTYLHRFDKEYIPMQTVRTKPITDNSVRLIMADVRKVLSMQSDDLEDLFEKEFPDEEFVDDTV